MNFNKDNTSETVAVLLAQFLFLIALVIAIPCLVIWSVNTLFLTGIEINFFTWVATLILMGAVKPFNFNKGDK